ncbi:YbfB/YjiJ family MFS transporter, partial [Paraburkholderia sp. BCC1885]|uniref:YbfB/YjiJ family MFS transporter n=1 Tax=Paraburkholderia sp. BCC1885 TaxID=2562669 RepID=UPI001182C22E
MSTPSLAGAQAAPGAAAIWRAIFAGLCASLVGIGLARFAYTPLLPAIVDAHWFAPSLAAYLGAANLAGYLGGALAGRALAARAGVTLTLRTMMLLAAPTVLAHVPASRRGLAGGVIFMGVGVGVVASGTVVPLLLQRSLQDTWLGLALLSLVLTALAEHVWPRVNASVVAAPSRHRCTSAPRPLRALYAE